MRALVLGDEMASGLDIQGSFDVCQQESRLTLNWPLNIRFIHVAGFCNYNRH